MLTDELRALRDALTTTTDFSATYARFLDLAECGPLLVLSRPTRHAGLERAVGQVAIAALGLERPPPFGTLFLLRHEDLLHGGIEVAGRLGTFFYCEQADAGLLGLPGARETRITRFRLQNAATRN